MSVVCMRGLAFACMALATGVCGVALADEVPDPVTFTKDVLPILQENCQVCHRPLGKNLGGMVAPMSFMDYRETRPWAKSIAKSVAARSMPPWDAAPEHAGVFEDERVLTEEQIATIVKWSETGALRGNPADAPEPKVFPDSEGWSIGEPDLVLSMPEPYWIPDELYDATEYFEMTITEEMLPNDRWIKAAEFRPGSEAVHHIIALPIGGIAPGSLPEVYRDGYSRKLESGSELIWNMHYHKEPGPGTGMWDQSSVGIKFYPEGYVPEHVLNTDLLGTKEFTIPAHDPNYKASVTYTFEQDALISKLLPHMHYRGKRALYTLEYPDGREETLLSVPNYDYNWQTTYKFKELKSAPAGSKVHFTGWWDNSADNPSNPDPTIDVTFGEATHEEMLFGFLTFANADEDHRAESIPFGGRRTEGEGEPK